MLVRIVGRVRVGFRAVRFEERAQLIPHCRGCANHCVNAKALRDGLAEMQSLVAMARHLQAGPPSLARDSELSLIDERYRGAADRVETARPRIVRSAECVSEMDAVIYIGWEGRLHTFRFLNPGYAQLFAAVNESKIAH